MNSAPGRKGGSFVRNSATSSAAALAAMLSGLLLDLVIVFRFGAGSATDGFSVASKIPIALTALLMTVATQTLVPAFVREAELRAEAARAAGPLGTRRARRRRDPLSQLVARVLTTVVGAGLALWALSWVLADPLVSLTASGLSNRTHDSAVALIPIAFLLVPLAAAAETVRSALNAADAFVAPAAMHLFMNVPAAGIILGWSAVGHLSITIVTWAYVAGAVIQLAVITAIAESGGIRIRLGVPFGDPRIRAILGVGRGSLGASLLNLGNRIIEQAVVSYLPTGSLTLLSYGNRLISALGGGVFFRPAVVAMMPRLSRAEHAGDAAAVRRHLVAGLRFILVISLPLTAFTVSLAMPVIRIVFENGNVTPESVHILALTLAVYGFSLVGSGVQRILLAVFYARQDTRAPLWNTFVGVLVDLALMLPCLVLAGSFLADGNRWIDSRGTVVGIAAAFSITQYVIVWHAWRQVRRTVAVRFADVRSTVLLLIGLCTAASGVMMALVHMLGLAHENRRPILALLTVVIGVAGALVLAAGIVPLVRGGGLRPPRNLRSVDDSQPSAVQPGASLPGASLPGASLPGASQPWEALRPTDAG